MAEYIDRTQLKPDCEWSEYEDGYISYSQEQIERLKPADVIERSEYEKIQKQVKALQNRCKVLSQGIMCVFCPLECEVRTAQFRGD